MRVICRPSKFILWQSHFVCHLALNVASTVKIALQNISCFGYICWGKAASFISLPEHLSECFRHRWIQIWHHSFPVMVRYSGLFKYLLTLCFFSVYCWCSRKLVVPLVRWKLRLNFKFQKPDFFFIFVKLYSQNLIPWSLSVSFPRANGKPSCQLSHEFVGVRWWVEKWGNANLSIWKSLLMGLKIALYQLNCLKSVAAGYRKGWIFCCEKLIRFTRESGIALTL